MRQALFSLLVAGMSSFSALYAVPIYLTNGNNQLIMIDSTTPGTANATVNLSGLQTGETLVGIDFRPATGQLYGVGSSSRIYTIDAATGAVTQVGAAGQFTLAGSQFGVDFNPVPDRLRVVSNTGQNLRLNPITGGLAATDLDLNGATTSAMGSAYTNSFAGATTTTLYNIDATTDSLYIQNPPNNGTQVLVGALGIDVTGIVGFDIQPGISNGIAYAALQTVGGPSSLYTINLSTGLASLVGSFGSPITGLAVQPIPEPTTVLLSGMGLGALLLWRKRRSY
jgi:hypothetical protein